jgi:hypothetical protein
MSDKAETNETLDRKGRRGRKNTYSLARLNELLGFIEDGLNLKQSCQATGISESTLRAWRKRPGVNEKVEAAREIMRGKILAQIKKAGRSDWRALAEYLRLAFPEYRYGNGPSVNIAVQQNMEVTDKQRTELIARREKALANAAADAPPQLADASDARREEALAAERSVKEGVVIEPAPSPEPERPARSAVDHAKRLEEREWRIAGRAARDELDEVL